jgi:CubicO group peptidase (beta-lactamase class C family)
MSLFSLIVRAFDRCRRATATNTHDFVVTTNEETTRLIDALNAPYTEPHMPGAIVAILVGGQVVFLKGYGLASCEFGIPWDPTVIYTYFSTTKSMTAAAVLTAQDRGLLSLDDEIQNYLPDFPRFREKITIRELLNHTSGLWQDEELVAYLGAGASMFPITNQEMYELGKKQPALSFCPGSSNYYNDAGMRYTARILETVTGRSFAEAMKDLLFTPAGMVTARIKPLEPMWFEREAPTYDLDRTRQMYPDIGALVIGTIHLESSGDGAASGSMLDYIQYARYLSKRGKDGKTMIERITEPVFYRPGVVGAYRYCMRVQKYRGFTVFEHGGFYGKLIAYLPKFDTWILTMRNGLDYSRVGFHDYLYRVIDAFCSTDERCDHFMSSANPYFEETREKPIDQHFTEEEFSTLKGTFVEPDSGVPIHFYRDGRRIRYKLLSTTADLVRSGDGTHSYKSFENTSQDIVQVYVEGNENQISLLFADWGTPRKLIPTSVPASSSPGMEQFVGLYRSPVYGAVYDVRLNKRAELELRIGAGARWADRLLLTHVVGDIFEAAQEEKGYYLSISPVVNFVRRNGKVTGMVINGNGVRGLELKRLNVEGENSPLT